MRLILPAMVSVFVSFGYPPYQNAFASSDPFITSSFQHQQLVEHREETAKKMYLGRQKIWELLGLALSLALFIEIINSVRREPNILEVFSGFLVAAFLSLAIYHLFGLIEGSMNAWAQSIAGSTSYWDVVVERSKAMASSGESVWTKTGKVLKIALFNLGNPLAILLHIVNYSSYLFVLVVLKIIKIVQETILTYLHVVAPIVVALSVIPGLNLVPSYILLIISISSWTLFAAIVGKVMSITGGSALTLTSLSDLIVSAISNITGGFAVLAATRFSVSVFQGGGAVGSMVNQVIGLTMGVAKTISGAAIGATVGAAGGLLGAGGKTAEAGISGAVSGAMLGASGSVNSFINPSQTLRGFLKPKKLAGENSKDNRGKQKQAQGKSGSYRPPSKPKKPGGK